MISFSVWYGMVLESGERTGRPKTYRGSNPTPDANPPELQGCDSFRTRTNPPARAFAPGFGRALSF